MRTFFIFLLTLLLFNACSPESQKKYDSEYKASEDISFEDWKKQTRLNEEPLDSASHNAFIDIYANDLGAKAYIQKAKVFPVGAELFKPLYTDTKRKKLVRLVVMVKKEQGYDSENGDWWYGIYDKTGKEAWYQGRINSCIQCHRIAKESDYLFTESVMDNIEMQAL